MINKKQSLILILSLGLWANGFAATDATATQVAWSYSGQSGPQNWGQLNPDFNLCGTGKTQSPINITGTWPNTPDFLNINYVSAPLIIMENGPTTLELGHTKTIVNTGHGTQVNFSSSGEQIDLDGTPYQLVQFHIHTPSENQLQGKRFPAEIHFVHQGPQGQVAVIGVFVKIGKPNATLQEIIDHIPQKVGIPVTVAGVKINPAQLIPMRQNYYQFKGSLTTPPCTEGLEWLVMINPISASQAQINALTAAAGGPNARPIQPLNGRKIMASVEKA